MATAGQIEQQMMDIQNQMAGYTPANIQDVTSDLMAKVGSFKPQYQEQAGMQQQAYEAFPSVMSQYAQRYPQGGVGPGAFNMLQSGLGNVGRLMGRSDVMGNVIDRQGGRIEDLARSALGQYQAQQDALSRRYSMLQPMWSTKYAAENRGGSGGNAPLDLSSLFQLQEQTAQPQSYTTPQGYQVSDASQYIPKYQPTQQLPFNAPASKKWATNSYSKFDPSASRAWATRWQE